MDWEGKRLKGEEIALDSGSVSTYAYDDAGQTTGITHTRNVALAV